MDKELKIKVKVGSQPLKDFNAEIRKAKEELAKLDLQGKRNSKEYKDQAQYLKTLNKEYDRLQQNTKEAGRGAETSSRNFTELTAKIGAATVAVYAAVASFQKLYSLAQQGAAFGQLYAAFEQTAGGAGQAAKALELLRKSSSDNLNDEALIQYRNEMASLGYTLEQTAQLLDIADVKSDELGITFQKGQDALQKFITTGSGRGLLELGINIGEVEKALLDYTGATKEQFDALDELTQQQVRATVISNLYGQSIDEINKKVKGNDDIVATLQTKYENLSNLLSVAVSGAFVEVAKNTSLATDSLNENYKSWEETGKSIGRFLNIAYDVAMFLPTMQNRIANLSPVIAALISPMETVIMLWNKLMGIDATRAEGSPLGLPSVPGEDIRPGQIKINLPKVTTGKAGNTAVMKEEKTILTEAAKVQAELVSLEAERVQLISEGYDQTLAYYNLLFKIAETETKLAQLRGGVPITAEAIGIPRQAIEEVTFKPGFQMESVSVMEASKVVYDNVTKTLNALGIATDNFVGTLINGFNTVLSIMESVKAVNAILNFIPFLATGGTMHSAGLAVVGERGPELVQLPAGARVYNNADTNRLMNSGLGAQSVNVYVNASPNANWINTSIPKYFDKRNYKRIN